MLYSKEKLIDQALRVATNVTQRFDGDVVTVGVQSELDCDQKIVNCLHKIQEIITGVSLT